MKDIMLAVVNCWNSTDLFKNRDFFFTRLGVFPYHRDDDTMMKRVILRRINEHQKWKKTEEDQTLKKQESSAKLYAEDRRMLGEEAANNEFEITISHDEYLSEHFNLV